MIQFGAQANSGVPDNAASLASGQTPLAYFLHSNGPATDPVLHLGWVLASISSLVCVIIAIMLVIGMFRHRKREDPKLLSAKGGTSFVYVGTAVSTVALLGISVYMLVVLARVADPPSAPAVTITVTAYDWWWKVDYDDGPSHFSTANELHIPVGEPVLVLLKSADVIHAFWVPDLSGKTQAIPGVINRQWVQADRPGVFRGQCTQYCGVQHAHMAFEVYAQPRADFERWMTAQRSPASVPASAQTVNGAKLFEKRCAGCHTVRGSKSAGVQAPDLTHVLSRRLIAAGTIVNSQENLMDWVQHVQEIKPGTLMPDMKLSPAEARDLSAYLATLS
ncbi:cytochrome c oxidase subunit II [Caballeronia arationis]|uniref:cytochrome c oxidase subunit II n=1 Tax=Caballeronia arationis TaxID=1777142 RepID=UPI0007877F35|nr:cytochrome c oxidase subunit II [Caballeronia arationis]